MVVTSGKNTCTAQNPCRPEGRFRRIAESGFGSFGKGINVNCPFEANDNLNGFPARFGLFFIGNLDFGRHRAAGEDTAGILPRFSNNPINN